jgi:hypothetical protein
VLLEHSCVVLIPLCVRLLCLPACVRLHWVFALRSDAQVCGLLAFRNQVLL